MREMTEIEVLERKIELKEQHSLLTLQNLKKKRERLAILKSNETTGKGHGINENAI